MSTRYCDGTPAGRCRSGREGGSAKLKPGQKLCGGCARRARRAGERRVTDPDPSVAAGIALEALAAAGPAAGAVSERVDEWKQAKVATGGRLHERTVNAVARYFETEDRLQEHIAAPIPARDEAAARHAIAGRHLAVAAVEAEGLVAANELLDDFYVHKGNHVDCEVLIGPLDPDSFQIGDTGLTEISDLPDGTILSHQAAVQGFVAVPDHDGHTRLAMTGPVTVDRFDSYMRSRIEPSERTQRT